MIARTRRRALVALAVLVVLLMVGSYVGGGPARAGPSTAPGAPLGGPPGAAHLAPAALPATIPCNPVQSTLFPYSPMVAGVVPIWPVNPSMSQQSPCTVSWWWNGQGPIGTFNDELHITDSSPAAGSGVRWTMPITLPNSASIGSFVNDFYAGMVVTGDNASLFNQSFLQVLFTPFTAPNGSLTYNSTLSILSFHVGTATGGYCLPPYWGLNVTWNNYVACELEMAGGGAGVSLAKLIPGGQLVNVTFNGASAGGLTVYMNDSIQKKFSATYQLTSAHTGSTYKPRYNASCEDECYLNWSEPFGQGFGADLAATGFNITLQSHINPIEIGSAEYYTGSAYTGDYANISLESASGGCGGLTYTINCAGLLTGSGTQYPFFQFNGTVLNLGSGADYPWTTEDFNQYYQFESHANPNDTVPFWIDQVTNSSQAGFIGPNTAVTVSARAQDLGSVTSLSLSYTQPDGTQSSTAMTRVSGTSSIGIYHGTIPTSTAYGFVSYKITGTNHAGEVVKVRALTVQRYATIPRFSLQLQTNPDGCGGIVFNGTFDKSHTVVTAPANYYQANAVPCYPWVFKSWTATGVSVNNTRSPVITVGLKENGSLAANWKYVRPFDHVDLRIATNTCGAIILNGTTYTTNQSVLLLDALKVPLTYASCAGNTFSGWVVAIPANVTVLGGNPNTWLTLHGNGSLVLTYVPTPNALGLVFRIIPSYCGGILFRGAGYTNNVTIGTLQGVHYPIAPDPCPHWGLLNWSTDLGLTVAGNALTGWNLTMQAPGTVTIKYYHLTEVTIETLPSWCGYILWDGTPEYNGTVLIVDNGSTHTAFDVPCKGYYFTGFYTTGGVTARGNAVTVHGSGILEAVDHPGTPTNFVAFITDPTSCPLGGVSYISYNGRNYSGSGYAQVPLNDSEPLVAYPCTGYGFVGWEVGGVGITVGGIHIQSTHVWVNGSGSITAHFHPLEPLYLYTTPSTCGSISVNGVNYTTGAKLILPAPNIYRVNVSACPHYGFLYWLPSSGVSVGNGSIDMASAARLTAVFGPLTYQVLLNVGPGDCGAIKLGTNQYVNNTTVGEPFGNYTITATPCSGFHLKLWTTTGGVHISGPVAGKYRLEIDGSGSLFGLYRPVDPTVVVVGPASADLKSSISFSAIVGTLVPPYTYSFVWDFGDGATATTAANFTSHAYASLGTYKVSVTVHDPYKRSASANTTVKVEAATAGGSNTSLTVTTLVAIGIGAAAIIAAVLLALRGGRARSEPNAPAPTEARTDTETDPPGRTEP